MAFRKRYIVLILLAAIIIPGSYLLWDESFYFDMAPMLTPIEHTGSLPVRNDWRGKGDFGARRKGRRRHQGIDILAPIGTPVRAAKGGIAIAGENKKGMGNFIRIIHKHGLITIYGHLSKIYIKPVQMIRQGRLIGEVGNTGNARYNGVQPHLHFEVRAHGVAQDPKDYLSKEDL